MDGFALDEAGVLILAQLVLDLVHGELGFEFEDVVEEFDAALGQVVEQVGVGAVLVVHDIGEGEEFLVGIEERILDAFQPDAAGTGFLFDTEGDEGGVEKILIKAVIAQGLHEVNEVGCLTRINDAETIGVPADGVGYFINPPVVVFTETNETPVEDSRGVGHDLRKGGEGNSSEPCRGWGTSQTAKLNFLVKWAEWFFVRSRRREKARSVSVAGSLPSSKTRREKCPAGCGGEARDLRGGGGVARVALRRELAF